MSLLSSIKHPKVLLVGPGLSGGGAETRFSNIASNIFAGEVDVSVLSLNNTPKHKIIDLGWDGKLSYIKVIWNLRTLIQTRKYDVIMTFGLFPSMVSVIGRAFSKGNTKIVINEITRPKMAALASKKTRAVLYTILRKWTYKKCDLITANSIDGLKETCDLVGVPKEQGIRVVNVVDSVNLLKKANIKTEFSIPEGKYIICIGRLEYMKCIDTVVTAMKNLDAHTKCKLLIVGDGPARSALEQQVKCLKLQESVMFTGWLKNPLPVLKHASSFILASEFEGFSNSVLEAMTCDVPVITSFCSSDACEMCVQGAALGFDVGDAERLAENISRVLNHDEISKKLIHCAVEYRRPHMLDNAVKRYEELICKVAGTYSATTA